VAERTTTLAFILKDSASKGMRELNKTARNLEKTAGTLNAPFAAAAKGFAIAAGAAVAVGGAMFAAAKAAAEEDASIARLNAAISANTTITDEQTKQMDAAIEARQNLAFSDDALRDSLSRLVPRTGDVTKAIELQSIAMDFARLRGVDLSTASDLVGKVFSGNTSILSRYGFTVEKGATSTEALAMIQQAAAGQAEAYGDTTQGALESIQIAIDNTVEDIGRVVLPILAEVLTTFRDEIMPRVKEFGIAFANAFTQAIDKLRPFIDTMVNRVLPVVIAVGGAIIGTLVAALSELGKFIGDNTGLVLAIIGAYTAFTIAVNVAATATRLAATAMGIFNAIMAMNPIVLVVAAIAALVAGFIIAYNTITPFRELVDKLFAALKPVITVVGDLVLMVGTNIVRAFGAAFDVVKSLVGILWGDGDSCRAAVQAAQRESADAHWAAPSLAGNSIWSASEGLNSLCRISQAASCQIMAWAGRSMSPSRREPSSARLTMPASSPAASTARSMTRPSAEAPCSGVLDERKPADAIFWRDDDHAAISYAHDRQ